MTADCKLLLLCRQTGAALAIVDHLRRGFARFKLCAHFLQARCKRVNLLLLVRDDPLLLLQSSVLLLDESRLVKKPVVARAASTSVCTIDNLVRQRKIPIAARPKRREAS